MKAMIFAAGLGTRLKPLTDTMPKALVPIAGKPLIQHVTEKLVGGGFTDIVVNIHHFADMIEEWGSRNSELMGCTMSFSDEREALLETGGGVRHAAKLLEAANEEGRFLIHNVDILSNVDLGDFWRAGANCDALLLVSERDTQRYLIFDANDRLVGWTNIKTGEVKTPYPAVREAFDAEYTAPIDAYNVITSPFFRPNGVGPYRLLAFAGIHQMNTRLLKRMQPWPEKFSIIDFYLSMCKEFNIRAYTCPSLRIMDVGKIGTLDEAARFADSLK